jgi:carbon monoxide dehydrogenase subunit G
MIIEETFVINAPLQTVWDYFFDLDRMSACIPGASVTQLDSANYEGVLTIKLGPLSASLGGTATITAQAPPHHIEAALKAKDKFTSSLAQGTFTSNLKALSATQTEVHYSMDVVIRGKLGQIAGAVVKSTAQKLSAQFLECAKGLLENRG